MATPRHTFRKHERLCGTTRFKEVITSGSAVHAAPFRLVGKIMALPTVSPAQAAFAVPKRNLRRAADRNRMKRLMREAYRRNKARYHERLRERGAQCAWLFVYQGRETIGLAETELKITRALDRWMKDHG